MKMNKHWGARLAPSEEHEALDLKAVRSDSALGMESTLKQNKTKQQALRRFTKFFSCGAWPKGPDSLLRWK